MDLYIFIRTYSIVAETKRINLYQAVNEALATALATDETAGRNYNL